MFTAVLGSFAPAGAQRGPQLEFTPVAQIYLPLVESNSTSDSDTPTLTPTLRATSTFTPTPTPTFTVTPTPTSTAYPAPPTLIAPANGVVLKQPIDGNEWLFQWNARTGPCYSSFEANGPNGYSISAFVHYQTSSPGPYSYHYTRTVPFPAKAVGLWTWQATVVCPTGSAQSETRTFYLEGDAPTPTPTPTSYPAPPTLIAPSNGAVLTQPIGMHEWLFHWDARMGPCHSAFSATGPNGYSINALVYYQSSSPGPYSYHYTRAEPFPTDAVGLWTWQATVICPLGSAQSETRTFYLQGDTPTPTPTCTVDW